MTTETTTTTTATTTEPPTPEVGDKDADVQEPDPLGPDRDDLGETPEDDQAGNDDKDDDQ